MAVVILLYDQLLFRPVVAWAAQVPRRAVGRRRRSRDPGCSAVWRAPIGFASPVRPVADALRSRQLLPHRPARAVPDATLPGARPRPRASWTCVWFVAIAAVAVYALYSVVAYVATELGWRDVGEVVAADLLHAAARGRADGAGDAVLGADQRLDRLAAALGRGGPAGRAVPRRVPGQPAVRRARSASCSPSTSIPTSGSSFLSSSARNGTSSSTRSAARRPFPTICARRRQLPHPRLGLVAEVILPGVAPYYLTGAITASGGSWNASIVAEWVKWKDQTRRRPRRRRLYRRGDRQGRLPPDRARRRDDVDLRHPVQPPVLAPALRHTPNADCACDRQGASPCSTRLTTLLEVSHVSQTFAKGLGRAGDARAAGRLADAAQRRDRRRCSAAPAAASRRCCASSPASAGRPRAR